MPHTRNKQHAADHEKIDINDTAKFSDAAKSLRVTPNRLRQAVEAVGISRDKIKQYLSGW